MVINEFLALKTFGSCHSYHMYMQIYADLEDFIYRDVDIYIDFYYVIGKKGEVPQTDARYKVAPTPLSKEDFDALTKLLKNYKIRLPSTLTTLEEAKELLLEIGLKELSMNLRSKLTEGASFV